jgi:hypothetical protein
MQRFTDIINAWPHPSKLAEDIGVTPALVAVWKHRDSIPSGYWLPVETAAMRRGIDGVTAHLMWGLARAKRQEAAQ